MQKRKLDEKDILVSVACGAVGGLIDIFFVGEPGNSPLGKWTNKMTDNAVMKFAKHLGWSPHKENENNVRSAIGYLEHGKNNGNEADFQGFRVNYDQSNTKDVNGKFQMASNQHHMMSIGHSPDIVGLFFSVLNQFTNTSTFISDGKLISIATLDGKFMLVGNDFWTKLLCGVWNWFGHLMSDVAGSSGSAKGGSGIVLPFYEFFGFCKFGKFRTSDGMKDLSELAMKAFSSGYDFRHGMAMAIPVVLTEMLIRSLWVARQFFEFDRPINECIPTSAHEDLRLMLIIGNATLCVLDGVDAAIRSGGNALKFFLRLNLIAWFKLVKMVLKEIAIRLMMDDEYLFELVAEINRAVEKNLEELRLIDIEAYEKERDEIYALDTSLRISSDDKELTNVLYEYAGKHGIELQFGNHEEFDRFMLDENTVIDLE